MTGTLSFNQITTKSWSVREAVDGCVRAGVEAIGLWREPVADTGLASAAKIVADSGMRVSSYCRGGFLTGADATSALDDNRRALDEAAALGAPCLVMVVGGLPAGSRDLVGSRRRVADRIGQLVPHAQEVGVRIALEPLHPMFCSDRAVLSTLGQALDMAAPFPVASVGVVVDAYHVWWDPAVHAQIVRAGSRIASYQVCDWVLPLAADPLLSRGLPGDGVIDLPALTRSVALAGYTGDVEVEVFNARVWSADGDATLATTVQRFADLVAPYLTCDAEG